MAAKTPAAPTAGKAPITKPAAGKPKSGASNEQTEKAELGDAKNAPPPLTICRLRR